MLVALGWGLVAASSLVLGVLLAFVRPWPERLIGLVLAFGAGALISAVSFSLAEEGFDEGAGWAVGLGLAAGSLTYYAASRLLDWQSKKGRASGSAVAREYEKRDFPKNSTAFWSVTDWTPEDPAAPAVEPRASIIMASSSDRRGRE